MINPKYLLFISVCLLLSAHVQANEINLTFGPSRTASGKDIHTPHTSIELKPISHFDSPGVKIAAVCSIGGGGCASLLPGLANSNGNFFFDPVQQCKDDGYIKTTCPAGTIAENECPYQKGYYQSCSSSEESCKNRGYIQTYCTAPAYLTDPCPDNPNYYKSCSEDNGKACEENGFSDDCEPGKIADTTSTCPYNSAYTACKCNPCTGYGYTLEQAQTDGWHIMGDACNSCGELKYMREADICSGFYACNDEGGEAGADTCMSGDTKMFSSCKTVSKECAAGFLNMDKYWCEGALRCYLPVPAPTL